jgi:hypothetical protein
MSNTIYITKTKGSSFSSKKIPREEFEKMVDKDGELVWLENSPEIGDKVKKMYPPRRVAIWAYGNDENDTLWVELNDMGTIDFGYRPHGDPELDDVFQKIVEMAWKLGCYVEGEGGELLYDPAEDK